MLTSETIHPDKHHSSEGENEYHRFGAIQSIQEVASGVVVSGREAKLLVQFVRADVIRVKLSVDVHKSLDFTTSAAVKPDFTEAVQVKIQEQGTAFQVSSPDLEVIISKSNGAVKVITTSGKLVCQQTDLLWDARGAVTCVFPKSEQSHFYGLGETTGFLDKNHERYTMWNSDVYAPHVAEMESLYESIPFLIHQENDNVYGIFLDNTGKSIFDMRLLPANYQFKTLTGDMDMYLFHAANTKALLKQYTDLTGRMELPPKWALGYHQSRYSYMNQAEVLELARTFRAKQIPCDVIYLDIHYMDEYRVFTFDKQRFPDPKQMLQELRELGFYVVPIVDPGVKKDPKYDVYREGVLQDYFCKTLEGDLFMGPVWPGISAFPDFTEDEASQWWGDLHQFYTELGIKGIWNDMNEPAVFNESKTMDLDVMHRNNGDSKTHEELHNIYGMLMSKATFEGLKRHLDNERPFVLTRAGYAGVQRYAAVWTGDNRSFWEHMAMAMPMVMNLGLSGVCFSGPDIGGFAHHTNAKLLARWTQMGAFFPYCRNHSALDTIRQEPWSFGDEVEAVCRKYLSMRYAWMPYMYSLFYEASRTGLPVMRPLLLEYPNDSKVSNLSDQFLFGSNVLIAPIYRPDTDYRSVYLPDGQWYDYWTGEQYEGNQHILIEAPLDVLPMFVKAGAVVPTTSVKPSSVDLSSDDLKIMIAAPMQHSTTFEFYEDDGLTYNYADGSYNLFQIKTEAGPKDITISLKVIHRGYYARRDFIEFHICYVNQMPQEIAGSTPVSHDLWDQVQSGWTYLSSERQVRIKCPDITEDTCFRLKF